MSRYIIIKVRTEKIRGTLEQPEEQHICREMTVGFFSETVESRRQQSIILKCSKKINYQYQPRIFLKYPLKFKVKKYIFR